VKTLHLKPALLDGKPMVIRNPATGLPIPAHGISVPATPFWITARRVGDVVDTTVDDIAAAENIAVEATAKPARKAKE
jgi:hypothetical protein